MIEIVIGTGNPHKRAEIESILAGTSVTCLGLDATGPLPEVVEDGDTLEANAVKKACRTAEAVGRLALADDSGLEVDALGGRPGVFSARYAGPECDQAANNNKLLAELSGVPKPKRTAVFRCVMAVASPDGLVFTVEGRCEGRILEAPSGKGGFGYDPLFYYPPAGSSFADMSPEAKNRVSHRCRALEALRREFVKRYGSGP